MSKQPNVFISWSGPRSLFAAKALYEWLPVVIQTVVPWMSANSIDKGTKGVEKIEGALEQLQFGVVCLTPENLESTWVHYEAGALTKLSAQSRLWTYLLCGLRQEQVRQPLGNFQHTVANKEGYAVACSLGEQGGQ